MAQRRDLTATAAPDLSALLRVQKEDVQHSSGDLPVVAGDAIARAHSPLKSPKIEGAAPSEHDQAEAERLLSLADFKLRFVGTSNNYGAVSIGDNRIYALVETPKDESPGKSRMLLKGHSPSRGLKEIGALLEIDKRLERFKQASPQKKPSKISPLEHSEKLIFNTSPGCASQETEVDAASSASPESQSQESKAPPRRNILPDL
jgi:hypothetical protein